MTYVRCIFCLLLIAMPLAGVCAQATSQDSEETAITQAVESLYVKGLQDRNFDLITAICVPEAVLMGTRRDGSLNITTLEQWKTRFDPAKPPFTRLDYTVARVDITGTAAQVRIDFVIDGQRNVTDFLNMLKIGDTWKVVNIIDY